MDQEEIIERARKKGADMSWLREAKQPVAGGAAPTSVEQLSPGAAGLMGNVQQHQAQTPVYMPFPRGAPTQRRREADTQAGQWDQQFEEGIRQFDMGHAFDQEKFQSDEAYRQAQLALQRASGAPAGVEGEGAPHQQEMVDYIYELVDESINRGLTFSEVKHQILRYTGLFGDYGISPEEAESLALGFYEQMLDPSSFPGSYEQAEKDLHQQFSPEAIEPGTYKRPDGSMYYIDEMGVKMELDEEEEEDPSRSWWDPRGWFGG